MKDARSPKRAHKARLGLLRAFGKRIKKDVWRKTALCSGKMMWEAFLRLVDMREKSRRLGQPSAFFVEEFSFERGQTRS